MSIPTGAESSLPDNLHVHEPLNGGRSLVVRMEQKYFVVPALMGQALALLRRTCRWDGQYPEEQINSLYFDTPDLDHHEMSLAGEFAKDKIRVRWYGSEHDPHGSVSSAGGETATVWLELKSRRGFASTKQRRMLQVPAAALALGELAAGIVSHATLMHTVAEFGYFCPRPLHPVIVVSYRRCRFVEPRTGLHVALDSLIRSSVARPGIGRGERGLLLAGAVLEVKGPSGDLPLCLRPITEFGSSWTRYSKYSSSVEAHMSELGSVSRLWPSGTMHAEPCVDVTNAN